MQHALGRTATALRWVTGREGTSPSDCCQDGAKLHGLHGPHRTCLCWRFIEKGLCVAMCLHLGDIATCIDSGGVRAGDVAGFGVIMSKDGVESAVRPGWGFTSCSCTFRSSMRPPFMPHAVKTGAKGTLS